MYFSIRVAAVARLSDAAKLIAFKDTAWRSIFWVSLPPGILFVIGSFMVAESPRWLFRRGRPDAAYAALLRSRSSEQADIELAEMKQAAAAEKAQTSAGTKVKESLLRRKYVIPFVLACVILACNQATGINSIIGYNTIILLQVCTALLFRQTERLRMDSKGAIQSMVSTDQKLTLTYNQALAGTLLSSAGDAPRQIGGRPTSLVVIYSYGDFHAATKAARSDDTAATPIEITRESCVPANKVVAFFSNPFGDLDAARQAPLRIDNALITPLPSQRSGWRVAITLFIFMAFYAIGPGVCVWLALSELMPTRIRSNGMSIALLLNQGVATTIAAIFLPTVGKHGYAVMFWGFAACTVIYFITAAFFLPETKGKTLEEIEAPFEGQG